MPNYMTAKEAAKKWGVSPRRVQQYCEQGRISGAYQHGHPWFIPEEAEYPAKKTGRPKGEK
jgi:predicted site-specific integrase-resolvase